MDYSIIDIPKSRLLEIKQLWEKLNQIHLLDSVYFKDHYKSFTFEMRIESFIKIDDENIKISIILNDDKIFGYCVSAISEAKGELESLYVSDEIRKSGYGKILVQSHIDWMKQNNCKKITVAVLHGHDSALGFYHKMGFYERLVEMEYKA